MRKTCRICKKSKALSSFYRHAREKDGLQSACMICQRAAALNYARKHKQDNRRRAAEWAARNPDRVAYLRRRHEIKIRFGITVEEYDLLVKAANTCAICKQSDRKLVLDHCHATGKIRGVICSSCNIGLGQLQDSIELLASAVNYLESGFADVEIIGKANGRSGERSRRGKKEM